MLEQKVERSVKPVNTAAREAQTSEKMTYEQRPEKMRTCTLRIRGEYASQVGSTACEKAWREEPVWDGKDQRGGECGPGRVSDEAVREGSREAVRGSRVCRALKFIKHWPWALTQDGGRWEVLHREGTRCVSHFNKVTLNVVLRVTWGAQVKPVGRILQKSWKRQWWLGLER